MLRFLSIFFFQLRVRVICFQEPDRNTRTDWNSFSSGQLEYRLTRLEVQVAEKTEGIRSELRETNRRLQALEWQNAETKNALEGFKSEMSRFTEQSRPSFSYAVQQPENYQLEEKVEKIAKGVQLVVTALRIISVDVSTVKNNLSSIAKNTK